MLSTNFKRKRTDAASRGFLATARLSCLFGHDEVSVMAFTSILDQSRELNTRWLPTDIAYCFVHKSSGLSVLHLSESQANNAFPLVATHFDVYSTTTSCYTPCATYTIPFHNAYAWQPSHNAVSQHGEQPAIGVSRMSSHVHKNECHSPSTACNRPDAS